MLSNKELLKLLTELESDSVERTLSTNNTDKFSEAICAFANDFPNHKLPGYLIIGAEDKTGKISGLTIDDKILKDLAAIRNNGQILPQPSMAVSKFTFPEGDLAVVEIFPHQNPPVRYKGKVFIRIGPVKALANEAEEVKLTEKRVSNAKTFDAMPALESNLDDMSLELFKISYLPRAIDEDTLEKNHRAIKQQLASLRLFDLKHNCATNAGIIILGKNIKYFIPGAYIQYVKFAGENNSSGILNEEEFSGDLLSVMRKLDLFVQNNIEKRPVYVSALKEEIIKTYPFTALREFLNNAVMHRNYESSNAPIKFYEYNNRIEISNPGGLYGTSSQNFPHNNDYRNPIIAEALKIYGYVNRFNIGISTAQSELQLNGNPEAEFDLSQPMHFKVTIWRKPI